MRLALLAMLAALMAGCSSEQNKTCNYNFKSNKWDGHEVGKLTIDTVPPHAAVYIKARYNGTSEAHTPHGDVVQPFGENEIDMGLNDWKLVGTTPVAEFSILTSGHSSDRQGKATAKVSVKLKQLSVRIEKEGFNTMELTNLGFPGGVNKLVLDLVPTTRPTQQASR